MSRRERTESGLLTTVLVAVIFTVTAGSSEERLSGDAGTKVCRDIQIAVQSAIPADPRNHGKVVSAAVRVVRPFTAAGAITARSASCIISQAAHRAPIEEQEACGPDRICGDVELDPSEECDDGGNEPGDGCRADCTVEECGDGIRDPHEQCDDGDNEPGDGCSADCRREEGPCGGFAGLPCFEGEFCEYPVRCGYADLFGVCVEPPEVCPEFFDPVCGCDGTTYPNDCFRRASRTSLNHRGECGTVIWPPGSGVCIPLEDI
jgi:cysteine-rich repeat protein